MWQCRQTSTHINIKDNSMNFPIAYTACFRALGQGIVSAYVFAASTQGFGVQAKRAPLQSKCKPVLMQTTPNLFKKPIYFSY